MAFLYKVKDKSSIVLHCKSRAVKVNMNMVENVIKYKTPITCMYSGQTSIISVKRQLLKVR